MTYNKRLYLDKGLEFTKDYIIGRFEDIIKKAINNDIILDYKTRLQEYLQKNGEVSIVYELIKFEGPPHRRKFYTKLIIDSKELTYGEGYSKKGSEQNAKTSKGIRDFRRVKWSKKLLYYSYILFLIRDVHINVYFDNQDRIAGK